MGHAKSDEAAGRPELFHRIGSADTQYDIVDNGDTLASGDCKPNHASETDVYVCRYTVGGSDSGAFTVKVGTGSADKASNALAAEYIHSDTLTLDTAPRRRSTSAPRRARGAAHVASPADEHREARSGNAATRQLGGRLGRRVGTLAHGDEPERHGLHLPGPRGGHGGQQGQACTAGPVTPSAADTTPRRSRRWRSARARLPGRAPYKIGDAIAVTATFSEALVLTGTPTLKIKVGAVEKSADCALKGTRATTRRSWCAATGGRGRRGHGRHRVEAGKLAGPRSRTGRTTTPR